MPAILSPHFVRFILTGGLNTVFGYSIFSSLIFMGISPQPALAFTTVIGVLFNYFSFSSLVFRASLNMGKLVRFIGVYVISYGMNAMLLWGLHDGFGWSPYTAQFIAIFPVAMLSYLFMKKLVYHEGGSGHA